MKKKQLKTFLRPTSYVLRQEKGQVMLLTVLVMSAVFLSATAIAGVLMVYQLGQVAKVTDSAKAIFAADAGIERGLFAIFRCNGAAPAFPALGPWQPGHILVICASARNQTPSPNVTPSFENGATYKMGIYKMGNQLDQYAPPDVVKSLRATGNSGKSARAFEVLF